VLIVARVVPVLSRNCVQLNFPDYPSSGHQVGDEIFCFASRIVDEAISDISEFLTDDEVAEVADALNAMVNQWRNPPTALITDA
jgi:HAMP domain-containing protein